MLRVAFVSLVVLLVGIGWHWNQPSRITPSTVVQTRDWTPNTSTWGSSPVIFSKAPSNQWECHKWNLSTLERTLPAVQQKTQSVDQGAIFWYFVENQPLSTLKSVLAKPVYIERIVSSKEFFDQVRQLSTQTLSSTSDTKQQRKFVYASGPIRDVLHPSLVRQIGDIGEVVENATASEMNVWFGGSNATAALHYDTSDNIYIPLIGRKRFLLFPPSVHKHGLHPSVHPYYRQMLPKVSENMRRNPSLFGGMEAVVNPGDVLWIPPFWFHHVETVTPAVAINIWTPSSAFSIMENAFALPLPFEPEWSLEKMTSAVGLYLCLLSELIATGADMNRGKRVCVHEETTSRLVIAGLHRRWKNIDTHAGDGTKTTPPLRSPTSTSSSSSSASTSTPGTNRNTPSFDCHPAEYPRVQIANNIHFLDRAQTLAREFARVRDEHVRTIYLANFAEHAAVATLGVESSVSFFQQCVGLAR
eukprot:m.192405 g.192405  ORF g.192405 m.192405 type:complete len:472 (-) comp32465_c0_seq2:498-1913(-)